MKRTGNYQPRDRHFAVKLAGTELDAIRAKARELSEAEGERVTSGEVVRRLLRGHLDTLLPQRAA